MSKKKIAIAIAARFEQSFNTAFSTTDERMAKLGREGQKLNRSLKTIDAVNKLKSELSDLRNELSISEKNLTGTERQYSHNAKKVDELTNKINGLSRESNAAQKALEQKKVKLVNAKERYRNLSKVISESSQRLKAQKQIVSDAKAKYENLKKSISESGNATLLQNRALIEAEVAHRKHAQALHEERVSYRKLKSDQDGVKKTVATLNKEYQKSQATIKKQKLEVSGLNKELKSEKANLKGSERAYNEAKKEVDSTTSAIRKQHGSLDELVSGLKKAGVNTKNLAGEQDRLSSVLKKSESRLAKLAKRGGLDKRLSHYKGKAMSDAFSLGASVVGAGALLNPGRNFEDQIAKVGAITNATDIQLKGLARTAKELGKESFFSASEVADAQSFLGMAGFTPDKIQKSIAGVLDLALSGGSDLAQTADIASNILSGFSLEASQMGRVGDVLTATFTSSNTTLESLGETLKYVAPIASSTGASIEQVAAAAGLLGDVGLQGSMAGTALRAVFNRLAAPPKMAQKVLEDMKIKTKDFHGNLKPVPQLLREVADALKGVGTGDAAEAIKKLFGEEAAAGATELIKKAQSGELDFEIKKLELAPAFRKSANSLKSLGPELLDSLGLEKEMSRLDLVKGFKKSLSGLNNKDVKTRIDKIFSSVEDKSLLIKLFTDSDGSDFEKLAQDLDKVNTAQEVAEKRTSASTKALKRLASAGENISIALGATLLPVVADFVDLLADAANGVAYLAEEFPVVTAVLGTATAALIAGKVASLAYNVAALAMGTTLKGATIAQTALNFAMKMNPVGMVVAGMVALGSAVYYTVKNWDSLKKTFQDFYDRHISKIEYIVNLFKDFAKWTPGGIAARVAGVDFSDIKLSKFSDDGKSSIGSTNAGPQITQTIVLQQGENESADYTAQRIQDVTKSLLTNPHSFQLTDPVGI